MKHSHSRYRPINSNGSVGPIFDFMTMAALWILSQPNRFGWRSEQLPAAATLRELQDGTASL